MKKGDLLKNIKQAILQQAIQGKLTKDWRKQNPDVEPASELLKRIKAEKEKLIKEKKIRKEKPLPPITQEEIPFELPDGWVWVILDEISLFKNGKAHEQFVDSNGKYILINSKFVSTNGAVVKYTGNQMMPMYKNEIAIVMSDVPNGRALSRCFLIDENDKYSLNQRIGGIIPLSGIYHKYLIKVLDRNKYYLSFNDGKKQTNLKKSQIMSCPIPVPPLAEQKAIVEKVESLMQQCDMVDRGENIDNMPVIHPQARRLIKLYDKINKTINEIQIQKESVNQLKQSILQEAIQGKLTADWRKQNPNIEPASELLKRIKAEKEKLIKEKKIHKEKPLPHITEDEIPFELPDGWVWCYISELAELYTGNSINKSEKEAKYTKQQKGFIYIGTKDVEFNMRGINYNSGVIIPTKELEKFKIAPKNTVLICIEGGSSGKKIGITAQDVCFGNKLLVANTYINELSKYLYYLYNSPHFKSEFDKQRKGLRGGVSVNSFKNIKIALPPLAEQKAIVEKVENLMQKVSAMEEEILKSEKNAEILMQAVLKEAFEGKKEVEE
ncbi:MULTISPECIES: restriction endonuclease subunit S [unclassified Lebetimonas]|uniref:restriction endonuclease subunit S n=1 Tax=unclassified Lebetimonas TaxID=2648158 RepID=UPI0004657EF6|nr:MULTISPECIES: restriction endonuclease subunit S [unclassified Lebetimonas]